MGPSLKKGELLSGKKEIEDLFDLGRSFAMHPYRVIWRMKNIPATNTVQVLFSVPKKKIGKAVHRNMLKRKMKEAYRLNKELLINALGPNGFQLALAFVYVGNELVEFSEIENKIILSLNRLVREYEKSSV